MRGKDESGHLRNARFIAEHLVEDMLRAARALKAYHEVPNTVASSQVEWSAYEAASDEVSGALRALRLNVAREVFGDTEEVERRIAGLLP